jgi:hypothetical protein
MEGRSILVMPWGADPIWETLGCDTSLYDRIVSSAERRISEGLLASTIL